MSKGPDQLAHQRLVSLAQARRRAAEKLPPISGITRERLLAEVERMRSGSAHLAEETHGVARVGSVWQSWLTWLGVAAAVGVLILVVRLSNYESSSRPRTMAAAAKDDAGRSSLTTAEAEANKAAPVPSSAPREPENLADASTAVSAASENPNGGQVVDQTLEARKAFENAPAAAPAVEKDAGAGGSPLPAAIPTPTALAGRSLLDAAHRIRRPYEANVSQGNPPPFLRSFEVSRIGSLIRLFEPDGSAYTGRISRLERPQGQAGPMEWSFEGKGKRQSAAGTVWIVGNFVAEAPASDASATPEVLDATLKVTVQFDGTNLFELRAAPAGP